jgi:hypothetical protein
VSKIHKNPFISIISQLFAPQLDFLPFPGYIYMTTFEGREGSSLRRMFEIRLFGGKRISVVYMLSERDFN